MPPVTVPSQYPSQTLHVGVAASAEDSRTYITLVSSEVPFGQDVVGGTLTLPVLTDTDAGTLVPETASLRACLVEAKVENGIEGGLSGAPAENCATSSRAVFTPAKGSTGPYFTIDLTPFAKGFSLSEVSLALVPGEQPGTAWHVAFSRSDRAAAGSRPISAQVRTASAPVEPTLPTEPIDGAPDVEVPPSSGEPGLAPVQPGVIGGEAPAPGLAPIADPTTQAVPRVVARPVAALSSADLAATTGYLLEAARQGVPVLLDGLMSVACALTADRIEPGAAAWYAAGHRSTEPAQSLALAKLGLEPLLDLDLRLGEGSGAVAAVPVVRSAVALLRDVALLSELMP